MDWKTATNEDALRAWDAGEPIWTCDMGGMGPGYEQCIQIMGFEMLRAMLEHPANWAKIDEDKSGETWRAYRELIEKVTPVRAAIEKLGPSGAQFGAAMNIASVFAKNGYAEGMEMVPDERRIQVSRKSPTLDGTIAA